MATSKPLRRNLYADMTAVLKHYNDVGEASGNAYDELLRNLSEPGVEAEYIIQVLEDLEQCVSMLNKDYQPLVSIIMSLNWLDKGAEVTSVYQSLMLNLVSAHMFYLKPCLRMLIKNFVPDNKKLEVIDDPMEARQKADQDLMHVHSLIKSLSQIVPMTSVLIVSILEDYFPYVSKGVSVFEYYTQGVLTVSTYLPMLRMDILELVVKNMLKLDVRSSRQDIDTAINGDQTDENAMEDSVFDLEDAVDLDVKPTDPKDRLAEVLPMAGSLDAMMSLAFQYIRDQCFVHDKLEWEVTKRLYRELLSVFDKFIFPTHASCHVQFLLFYTCSMKEALAEGFIDYLWKKVTDPTLQCVYRQTAACYIGSFLTRANYLSNNTAKEVMELMMKWIHAYLDQACEQRPNADLAHHGPFYSVCQSAFYIFCFKHNDFLQMKKGQKWAESLNFQRVVTSKLNPLRVCMPLIVKTFASATRMHQLAFCDTIIERNNRYSLPVTTSTYAVNASGQKYLEFYFPFDPYRLPRSSSYIVPLFREFQGNVADDEDAGDEEEDDFLPDEEEGELNVPAGHMSMSLGKSPVDFMQYGISPGFKHG